MADPLRDPDAEEDSGALPDHGSPPSTPRWVKGFGVAFLVLVLLLGIMMASGHGPGRHMADGTRDQSTPSNVSVHGVRQP